jgi:phosphoglycerate dehydrogenase-like enzyme
MKALYVLGAQPYRWIYQEPERARIAQLVDVYAPAQTAESVEADPSVLNEAEIILSGWGCPTFTPRLLDAAPHLRAIFYGAGTIKNVVTDEFWARGIQITSAYAGNAISVAEYTLSQILFALRSGWQQALAVRAAHAFARVPLAGTYNSTVGLISLGMVGRRVAELLRPFDMHVIAYDPYVSAERAAALGVELVSLDELFRRADVASLHTPWLKQTEGLITGKLLAQLKPYATFINTARGAVVCEDEMIEVLRRRPDLTAVLDVTYPEPPAADSPLYTLPNVILTPHIAGNQGDECRRMGQIMIAELERFIAGQPLQYGITREQAAILA